MKLRLHPDPVLYEKGEDIAEFDESLIQKTDKMFEIMAENNGIGLAAQQVGWVARAFVIELKEPSVIRRVCFNPEVIPLDKRKVPFDESCLSYPGKKKRVWRPDKIVLKYQNEKGEWVKEKIDGLLSRCAQHEYDHTLGKPMI